MKRNWIGGLVMAAMLLVPVTQLVRADNMVPGNENPPAASAPDQGSQSQQGPRGERGPQGPRGPRGERGPAGPAGTAVCGGCHNHGVHGTCRRPYYGLRSTRRTYRGRSSRTAATLRGYGVRITQLEGRVKELQQSDAQQNARLDTHGNMLRKHEKEIKELREEIKKLKACKCKETTTEKEHGSDPDQSETKSDDSAKPDKPAKKKSSTKKKGEDKADEGSSDDQQSAGTDDDSGDNNTPDKSEDKKSDESKKGGSDAGPKIPDDAKPDSPAEEHIPASPTSRNSNASTEARPIPAEGAQIFNAVYHPQGDNGLQMTLVGDHKGKKLEGAQVKVIHTFMMVHAKNGNDVKVGVPGVTLRMQDNDGDPVTLTTNRNGKAAFTLQPDKQYTCWVFAPGGFYSSNVRFAASWESENTIEAEVTPLSRIADKAAAAAAKPNPTAPPTAEENAAALEKGLTNVMAPVVRNTTITVYIVGGIALVLLVVIVLAAFSLFRGGGSPQGG